MRHERCGSISWLFRWFPKIWNVVLMLTILISELLFTKWRTYPKIAQKYDNNNGNNGNKGINKWIVYKYFSWSKEKMTKNHEVWNYILSTFSQLDLTFVLGVLLLSRFQEKLFYPFTANWKRGRGFKGSCGRKGWN